MDGPRIAVAEIVIGGFVFWAFIMVVLMVKGWLTCSTR
jgi:hypothetical protein